MQIRLTTLCLFTVMALAGLSGCEKPAPAPPATGTVEVGGHTHGAWWCDEHGVPEEVCTRCDPSLVADFKGKDDWCKEHDLPDSQCFVCHPEHEETFAKLYRAKEGKDPPAAHGDPDHKHEHGEGHGHDHEHKDEARS